MKLTSLLGLSLELLEDVATSGPLPADARVGRFFRGRRFLGSHDRRFIGEVVYAWLRRFPTPRIRWTAWAGVSPLEGSADSAGEPKGRLALLEDLVTLARLNLLPRSCDECLQALRAMSLPETGGSPLLQRVLEHPERVADHLPESTWPADASERLAADLCLPVWLATRIISERGEASARQLAATFLEAACVDLRVNRRRCSRDEAFRRIEQETNATLTLTPWSSQGIRISKRLNLGGTGAYREGWVEVADEGTQVMVLALDPIEGSIVVDACAGAGGKTLALADILLAPEEAERLSAPPRIIACDVSPSRLGEIDRRARRAGVRECVEIVPLPDEDDLPDEVPMADLVLIDAPCSGFGTLRRNPELKLRHGPDDIERFQKTQQALLARWAPRVKPGGRLAYVTCSILRAENEEVAAEFSAHHPGFTQSESGWAREHLPPECLQGGHVHVDPALTGTDGFFLAMWRRV